MIFLQLVSELSVEDLGEPVGLTMWELSNPHHSIAIGSGCIWSKSIFCATGRPGSCMVTGVPVNPGFRLGIVIVCSGFVVDGAPQIKIRLGFDGHVLQWFTEKHLGFGQPCICGYVVEREVYYRLGEAEEQPSVPCVKSFADLEANDYHGIRAVRIDGGWATPGRKLWTLNSNEQWCDSGKKTRRNLNQISENSRGGGTVAEF
eukprot:Gb_23690 [translate_table: standard]